jgi:phosphopantetheinyl transferase
MPPNFALSLIPDTTRVLLVDWSAVMDEPQYYCCDKLSTAEQWRTQSLHNPLLRKRFVITRNLLRQLLADCLGLSAELVPIGRSATGKPFLAFTDRGLAANRSAGPARHDNWHFSIAHSEESLALAFSPAAIGVDIECQRQHDWMALAKRFFTKSETDWLMTLPSDEGYEGFLRLWTLKESLVKWQDSTIAHIMKAYRFTPLTQPIRCFDEASDAALVGVSFSSLKVGPRQMLALATAHSGKSVIQNLEGDVIDESETE